MTDTEKYSLGNVAWGFPADNLGHAKADTATFKVGDMVEVVGKIDKDWSDYLPVLDRYIGKVGKITFIHDHATSVAFGHAAWNFLPANLRHAKAETSQPTPTEQLRAIAQAETALNMCRKIDRMRMHGELTEAQSNADFPAILAHVEAMEKIVGELDRTIDGVIATPKTELYYQYKAGGRTGVGQAILGSKAYLFYSSRAAAEAAISAEAEITVTNITKGIT